jgi:F-type H+-transporting ATPase subunit epsilon
MSKDKIQLKIVTPERVVYEGRVMQITMTTQAGEITILPNHRSYIAALRPGEMMVKNNQAEETILAVAGGFVEFNNNKLIILADEAQRAEEIDIEVTEKAKKRAEDIKNKIIQTDEVEYARVAATLEMEMAKLKVARRYIKRRKL